MTARILVIDDEDRTRKLFRKILEREGYEVVEAANGKEGIKLYREESIDLVITDIIMPEKEGIETIMDLRKEFPEIKIIAVSGGGRIEADTYLAVANKMGASKSLTKPFTPDEVLDAVTEVLSVE